MASGIPDSAIEEIKARTDIGELIASYGVQVRRSGSGLMACCPFHNEKTPSFSINPSRGFYHCFGCGESGDAIKFVQKQEGLSFMDAVRKLASRCGVSVEVREDPGAGRRARLYALMADVAQFYRRCLLKMKAAQLARDYLESRELGPQAQEDFLVGYAPEGAQPMLTWAEKNGYTPEDLEAAGLIKVRRGEGDAAQGPVSAADCYHRFGGRLMFSVRDRQGRVVAFSGRQLVERKNSGKYVNSPETEIFKKSNVLYAFDRAAGNIARSPHREAIVCEGQIDCIRLHISGFPVAVASQGTAFTDEHARMLSRVADAALLVFDDDAAGHKATIRSAGMLLAAGMPVRVISLPDGDDPDSFLRTKGAEAFKALMAGAESVVGFQCRVEQAKEADPGSLDAVSRVSKALLGTIACSPNAVLRASMVGECARLLGLPAAALAEELERVKPPAKGAPRPEQDQEYGEDAHAQTATDETDEAVPGTDAALAVPPPPCEMDFMSFLMANEQDEALERSLASFAPQGLFVHGFTRRFAEAWRRQAETGEDATAAFAESLGPDERRWFDAVLSGAGRTQASERGRVEILRDFLRALWRALLERRRGALPAAACDDETAMARLRMTADLKRLELAGWDEAEVLIDSLVRDGFADDFQYNERTTR